MTTQPEALRLADWCDAHSSGDYKPSAEAAAELRRLHELNQELLEALKAADKGIEAAFMEGFFSMTTYNDSQTNDEDECWKESTAFDAQKQARAAIAKAEQA